MVLSVVASLALAEFDLADLSCLAGLADNRLLAPLRLADRLFEVLALFDSSDNAGLLNLTVKAA